jgi:sulfate permease, SulP family
MFRPKLFTTLEHYSKAQFFSDAVAGIVVGIVAIPLAIAFAISSGLSPEKGLFTAVVAGLLISVLGGSRVQIGGPTGAFVVIVYGIVHKYGTDGLLIATFLAGILLVLMGIAKLGSLVKFIPHPVIVGFTSGIALIIFSSQVKDFFGLQIDNVPVEFIEKWKIFWQNTQTIDSHAFLIAALTVLIISFWPKISRRVPGSLVALILTSVMAVFFDWHVETIGTRFGELPHVLPMPRMPALDLITVQNLFQPAITIALLGAAESLLSATVSDGMIGGKHRSNTELIAQGIANTGSALFGGMPATGAIARTVTNIKNGGRTPVAGIVHALTVLLAILFFGQWIQFVPLACLAGILVVVAYHMSEWRSFAGLLKGTRGDILVLLSTFLATVLIDLTVAIEIGMLLSGFLFIKRMSEVQNIRLITGLEENGKEEPLMEFSVPNGVEIYEVNGPLFFGAAHQFDEADRIVSDKPKVRILRFRNLPMIDSTGLRALENFYHNCQKQGIKLLITGLHVQPLNEMIKSKLYDLIGEENVFGNMNDALRGANKILEK